MKCPDSSVLERFSNDPDVMGESLAELEAHISNCVDCQRNLELATRVCELPDLLSLEPSVLDSETDLDQPPELPGYTMERLAGKGGFGSVYRARQNSTGRYVAVKISRNVNRNQLKRNQLEANVAAQLDHPNLVRLYDSGSVDRYSFYVFEWVDGNLSERLANSLISLEQVVQWMLQLCQGVSFLHQLKIIHRDLKPSNILITNHDQVKLTDFGIVKDLRDPSITSTSSRAIGTPGFMAPEQIGLNGIPVGTYTDVYGLGAVLYSLLVGHAPFVGGEARSVHRQVIEQQPYAPSKVRRDLSRDLEVICLKCLEKNHKDRYESVDALAEDLQRFAEGRPIRARPIGRVARIWRACKRQPVVAGLCLAVSCLTVLGFVLLALIYRSDRLQNAELMTESFCKVILSASPDKLDALYEQADGHDAAAIKRNIDLLSVDPQLSESGRVRLLCLLPRNDSPPLASVRLATAIETLSAREVSATIQRLKQCPTFNDPGLISRLHLMAQTTRPDSSLLPIVALLAEIDSAWDKWPLLSDSILRSLTLCQPEDVPLWSTLLKPLDDYLLAEIIAQESQLVKTRSQELDSPANLPELASNGPLSSDSVLKTVWPWAQADKSRVLSLIKSMPVSRLAIVHSLTGDQRTTVVSLREEIDRLWARMPEARGRYVSLKLSQTVSAAGGKVSRSGGFVATMLQSQATEFIELLAAHGMRLSSIEPYELSGQAVFAAAFSRADAASEETTENSSKAASLSRCEISWSVPLDQVESLVADRATQGFHVQAYWVFPEMPMQRLALLWRKDAATSARFIWDEQEVETTATNLFQLDSSQMETELLLQTVFKAPDYVSSASIGVLKQRAIPNRDEKTRRFVRMVNRVIGGETKTSPTRWVEHVSGGDSYLTIAPTTRATHALQSHALLDSGYEPLDIYCEPETGRILSHWCMRQTQDHEEIRRQIASLAIAAWFLGDVGPVLEHLVFSRDPSLRTRIVETLGDLDQNLAGFKLALQHPLSVAQLQGLLLSLASWHPDKLRHYKSDLSPVLQALWHHDDSGVHFSADQLLRRLGIPEFKSIIRPDLVQSHALSQTPAGRNWYYAAFGLPFVIVHPIELDVLGCDERIPWMVSIDRRLGTLNRRIAVCAIETPDWLMRRHIRECPEFYKRGAPPQNNLADVPAAGYKLESTLRFCDWLSDQEGLTGATISINELCPDGDVPSKPLIECFLDGHGYRLPTNLEWEMLARAGTWTSNHLGNRFDFLSNYSWSSANCESHSRSVGLLKPNPLGLFDILGNVYEYAFGGNGVTGFSDDPVTNEDRTLDQRQAVNVRGGAFLSSRIYCSSGASHHVGPWTGDINVGFRIVRTLPAAER